MSKKFITMLFIITFLFVVKSQSQDMTPPKQINNSVYDLMVGEWVGESDMMGTPVNHEMNIYWDVNHQFIILDLMATSKENSTLLYEGKGIFGVDGKGDAKTWWFDSWGADGMATGSGEFGENTLSMTDGNAMYNASRNFTFGNNEMTMASKGSYKTEGKEVPFEQTTVYKKK